MNKLSTNLSLAGLIVTFLALPAITQNKPEGETRRTGDDCVALGPTPLINSTLCATVFANYTYSVRGIQGRLFNMFDPNRVYFTMKTPLAEEWKFQITTDIYRSTGSTSNYNGFAMGLKFAMVDYSPTCSVSVKFGMIPGPWNGQVESHWKYRGIAQTASDRYSLVNIADLGTSATNALPGKYGDISGYILNGPGYTAPENTRFKDYVLRATLVPFVSVEGLKGLTLGGLLYQGNNGTMIALA